MPLNGRSNIFWDLDVSSSDEESVAGDMGGTGTSEAAGTAAEQAGRSLYIRLGLNTVARTGMAGEHVKRRALVGAFRGREAGVTKAKTWVFAMRMRARTRRRTVLGVGTCIEGAIGVFCVWDMTRAWGTHEQAARTSICRETEHSTCTVREGSEDVAWELKHLMRHQPVGILSHVTIARRNNA